MAYNNSILSEVYNYYQTSLSPRPTTRFDAHKKSELKSVYNSILNQSKEEPVYLFGKATDIEKYTISMKESAREFQHDIAALGGTSGDELFQQKAIYSSKPDIIDAQYINDDYRNSDDLEDISVTVDSLAKPQVNKGYYMEPDQMGLDSGNYSFDVTTNQSSYELQFSISDTDTNIDVQKRLARLIDTSGIGLKAAVSTDANGKSALVISSTSSGSSPDEDILFSISDEDTSQKAGVIDYFGIRNTTQPASWASYNVNGTQFTSADNNVNLNGVYTAKLVGVTSENDSPVTVGIKPDYESLKDSINGIARSYNNFIKTASEFLEKHPRTTVLIDSMKRMTGYYSDTFNSLGLSQNAGGQIDVDEDKLSSALSNTATEDTISSMKNFTKSALRKISQVQLNPMDYVDKRIVAYKDPNKVHYPNPYLTSAYSGMLFNGYM